MSDDPVRSIVPGDRAAVLACFDQTAGLAFTVLSRLTAGDASRALDLVVDTYSFVDRTARRSGWADVDARWVVDAAHSIYAAMSAASGADETGPVATLTVAERVALSLHLVERRTLDEVAGVLDGTADEAAAAVQSGSARLATVEIVDGTTVVDVIRRGEVWFDDSMRGHARLSVGNGWSSADAPAARYATMLATSAPIAGAMRTSVSPFATTDPEHFTEVAEFTRTRRSRGTVVGAGLGIAAVLVALAVWVTPSNDGDKNAASSLTSSTSSTGPDTSSATTDATASTDDTVVLDPGTGEPTGGVTTDDSTVTSEPIEAAGFVLDPVPAGFAADGAGPVGLSEDPLNWFELWSSPDAARTAGRWFAVLAVDNSESSQPARLTTTAQRVDLAGNSALLDVTADGVSNLVAEFPGRQLIRFESFGLSTDELVRLATATTIGSNNRPAYGPGAHDVVDGLDRRASHTTTQSVLEFQIVSGGEGARAQYQSADRSQFFTIVTSAQVENDLVVASLISPDSRDVAAQFAPNRTVAIGGRTVHVGSLATPFKGAPTDADFNYVEWHEGASTILLVGLVDLQTLLNAVPVARLATADEWHEVVVAPQPDIAQQPSSDDPGEQPTPQVVIGENTTADGDRFAVRLAAGASPSVIVNEQRAADPASASSAQLDQFEDALAIGLDPEHPLITLDTINATIALVAFDAPPSAAIAVRFTVGTDQPIDVPINQVIGTSLYGAAFAFSEYEHCTVSLIDDAGNAVQTLSE